MKLIVTGATGLVGAEVIRQAILDQTVSEVTALVRKPLNFTHPKVKTIIHTDFLNYTGLDELFKSNTAIAWCLGISQTQVSKLDYELITFDYTLAAIKVAIKVNPEIAFLYVSGQGADSTEKSRTIFARIKGKTENALLALNSKKIYCVRPAGINPIHKNPNTSLANKLFIPFFPLFKLLIPSFVIDSDKLAMAIIKILKKGYSQTIIENKTLKEISES